MIARFKPLVEFAWGSLAALAIVLVFAHLGAHISMWTAAQVWAANTRNALFPRAAAHKENDNPFLPGTAHHSGVSRYHPILDAAGVGAHVPIRTDYFGFRNDYDAYFNRGDYRYVVMTGNSEAIGFYHKVTIAQHLERILTERTGQKWRVVNLARNGSTISEEINYYVHLGFALRPEFVISHSFTQDFHISRRMPKRFADIGMVFQTFKYQWGRLVHPKDYSPELLKEIAPRPPSDTVMTMVARNMHRYKALAESGGAHFIWGVQKFDPAPAAGTPAEEDWRLIEYYYAKMVTTRRDDIYRIDIIDFNNEGGIVLGPRDYIHTTDATALKIAHIYADRISPLADLK